MKTRTKKEKYHGDSTQDEVAEQLGMSRVTVASLERRALEKAKKILRRKGIGKDILPE